MENIANNAVSSLVAAITNVQTSIVVHDASRFPDPNFRILCGSELMLCTGKSSNTLTVQRAIEGTTAASHSANATVACVLTAAGVRQYIDDAYAADMTIEWEDIEDKPSEFPPEAHTHDIADVTGLQAALDGIPSLPLDASDGMQISGLHAVALTGDFSALENKPAPLTLNSAGSSGADIVVATDGENITASGHAFPLDATNPDQIVNAFDGDYESLSNKPDVPDLPSRPTLDGLFGLSDTPGGPGEWVELSYPTLPLDATDPGQIAFPGSDGNLFYKDGTSLDSAGFITIDEGSPLTFTVDGEIHTNALVVHTSTGGGGPILFHKDTAEGAQHPVIIVEDGTASPRTVLAGAENGSITVGTAEGGNVERFIVSADEMYLRSDGTCVLSVDSTGFLNVGDSGNGTIKTGQLNLGYGVITQHIEISGFGSIYIDGDGGEPGQVLTSNGDSELVSWEDAAGSSNQDLDTTSDVTFNIVHAQDLHAHSLLKVWGNADTGSVEMTINADNDLEANGPIRSSVIKVKDTVGDGSMSAALYADGGTLLAPSTIVSGTLNVYDGTGSTTIDAGGVTTNGNITSTGGGLSCQWGISSDEGNFQTDGAGNVSCVSMNASSGTVDCSALLAGTVNCAGLTSSADMTATDGTNTTYIQPTGIVTPVMILGGVTFPTFPGSPGTYLLNFDGTSFSWVSS